MRGIKQMKKYKPIKSQQEADEVLEGLVVNTMKTLNIKRLDAELRVAALRQSTIMDNFDPNDKICCLMVDAFLTSPQWNERVYQLQIERLEKTRG
jgi:hypothetical protein